MKIDKYEIKRKIFNLKADLHNWWVIKGNCFKTCIKVVILWLVIIFFWGNCNQNPKPSPEDNVEIINWTKNVVQKQNRKKTDWIVIHHSAGENFCQTDEELLQRIQQLHIRKGFGTLSYHFVIIKDKVYQCHRLAERIPGVENYNSTTINICLYGDFTKREPTQEELQTLSNLIKWIKHKAYKKPQICYHKDLNNTACCGDKLIEKINPLIDSLNNGY